MKQYQWLYLLFALFLTSCVTPQTPQQAIDEANALITVAANQIESNKASGITTKEDAQKELDKVKAFRSDVKEAQRLLNNGESVLALTKAQAVNRLVQELHKHVAKKAQEARNVR